MQMEWFHNIEGNKTKLNWFLMETALEHYDRIMENEILASYRKLYTKEQIAIFCTYFARRMKESLMDSLRGRRKNIITRYEYIRDYYPNHDNDTNDLLQAAANEAWEHMLKACEHCPQQCLDDYKSRCMEFDLYGN
jgi:hypothetical protein